MGGIPDKFGAVLFEGELLIFVLGFLVKRTLQPGQVFNLVAKRGALAFRPQRSFSKDIGKNFPLWTDPVPLRTSLGLEASRGFRLFVLVFGVTFELFPEQRPEGELSLDEFGTVDFLDLGLLQGRESLVDEVFLGQEVVGTLGLNFDLLEELLFALDFAQRIQLEVFLFGLQKGVLGKGLQFLQKVAELVLSFLHINYFIFPP